MWVLFANLISIVATGASSDARTLPGTDDEVRKMLTAELTRARPLVLLDNASERRVLDCSVLASVSPPRPGPTGSSASPGC